MTKAFIIIKQILKDFFINPFWRTWSILVSIGLSLIANAGLWYIFAIKIKQNPNPFFFATGIILLNIVISNYLFNREKLANYFLLLVALSIQIFMLAFSKYLIIVF